MLVRLPKVPELATGASPKLVLAVEALVISERLLEGTSGVYPSAPVTSAFSKVMAPVRVLKEETPVTVPPMESVKAKYLVEPI